jgi:hypothetical protein
MFAQRHGKAGKIGLGKKRRTDMGYHSSLPGTAMTMIRPKILIETARIGARLYRRERDLSGAIPGLSVRPNGRANGQIVARLSEAELDCEELRRGCSPAYRPGKHVQILSALIAEADQKTNQTKASGSAALRLAM